MKKIFSILIAIVAIVSMTSCHGVRPNADEEAVLIKKPWFFGWAGEGVMDEPVTTGCTWCVWTTSSETFKITPRRYDVTFDDIMSNDNTPLDYATYITLQIEKGKSPLLLQNYGVDWFKNNVEAKYRNFVRDEVAKYSPFDLMSNREVCSQIDQDVLKKINAYFEQLNKSAVFPVKCCGVITGRAKPNKEQLAEMNKTAAAIQAKQTQDRTAEMQQSREKAEQQRAIADKAYMNAMNLSADQFILLKLIEKGNPNIDVMIGSGATSMWNVRR